MYYNIAKELTNIIKNLKSQDPDWCLSQSFCGDGVHEVYMTNKALGTVRIIMPYHNLVVGWDNSIEVDSNGGFADLITCFDETKRNDLLNLVNQIKTVMKPSMYNVERNDQG